MILCSYALRVNFLIERKIMIILSSDILDNSDLIAIKSIIVILNYIENNNSYDDLKSRCQLECAVQNYKMLFIILKENNINIDDFSSDISEKFDSLNFALDRLNFYQSQIDSESEIE